jgi:hypothetical protein
MKNFRKLLLPILLSLVYFTGIFFQARYETPLSPERYEDCIRISNSKGLWQRLTSEQIMQLAQTICNQIVADIGLQPITVIKHDFGNDSKTNMTWQRESRIVRVNLNSVGLSPDSFIKSLAHEILGHAVQDALIAGEDIAVSVPEEIIEEWRENKYEYINPPSPHDYNVSDAAARQRFYSYRTQSVEIHANKAGNEFRSQTRQIVVRLPDDIEFILMFLSVMCAAAGILLKTDFDSAPPMSFEECILAIRDEKIMLENPLPVMKNLHNVLSAELGMEPLRVYMSSKPKSKSKSNSEKCTSYERVVFNKNCLNGLNKSYNPHDIIAEIAGETWRACSYEFGEGKSGDMYDYINEIISRAEKISNL